jgi:hypothetical protein
MKTLFGELFGHLLGRLFGDFGLILGMPLAFAFWCLDYALLERRRRPHHAIVLALAAAVILTLLLLPRWDARTLFQIGFAGALFYVPFFLHTRRRAASERAK